VIGLSATVAVLAAACSTAHASSDIPLYTVFAQRFRFHGMPARIAPGRFDVSYSNREAFPFRHELVLISIPQGEGEADVWNDAKATGADSEDDWLHWGEIGEVDTGATKVGSFDLPAGTYAFACWETGKPGGGDGPVHAALHMVYQFSVP
jgi:hypothetical protein